MKEILANTKSIRSLLGGAKYTIDYYQREYKWERKQVSELLDDLTDKFLETHDPTYERSDVEKYSRYFLGSIIISDRDGQKFIIDGQQRLTTLSLLLIFIYNRLPDSEDKAQFSDLIFSKKYGKKSFNIDVPERSACMNALFNNEPFDDAGQIESVRNIVGRFNDIKELFPSPVDGETLPYFADWLIENVHLVEITAYSDDDAYVIFETMNDRGLSLAPIDMLKGFLLANITDDQKKISANNTWKRRIAELLDLGKEEDSDSVKSWLRSQYAESIRERKRGATPQDFDRIGSEFHRWLRDNRERIGLKRSDDFARLIERDFDFYTRQYVRLRRAANSLTPRLETIFYNAQNDFTLQYPLLLCALMATDSESTILDKLRIVGAYIDILITRRIWNFRAIDYSTMQYAMFLVMKEIRGKDVKTLASLLRTKLEDDPEAFASNERFHLHAQNGRQIHRILARLTDYIETFSGQASRYAEYCVRSGKNKYEVEHIWSDHFERHEDEFQNETDFQDYRNRIGGLLLLPKSFNASYGDLPYEEKREHYLKVNLLAQSLHERAYERNPGFLRFVKESGLPFQPYQEFKKAQLDERQELYRKLAERIWDVSRITRGD